MTTKIVDGGLGGFCHAFHEFFLDDVPLVVLVRRGMDPCLADASVSTADADVLVRTAEATIGVSLEMGQRYHCVVVGQMAAHRHLFEPFASVDRERRGTLFVDDVHGAECPIVHLERLAMQLRSVSVAFVIGVCLDDVGQGQTFCHQGLHPFAWNDVRAVLLTRVKFYTHMSANVLTYLLVGFDESFGREVAGELYDGLVACPLLVRHILVAFRGKRVIVVCLGCHNAC